MIPKMRNVLVASGVIAALAVATTASAQSGGGPTALVVNAESSFTVALLSANEVPANPAGQTGSASITVNSATGQVCATLTTGGTFTGPITAMHIHPGVTGATGSPVVDFSVTSGTSAAKCVVTSTAQATAIIANPTAFYLNAHNALFPNGAIRGQLAVSVPTDPAAVHLLTEPTRAYDSRNTTKLAGNEARTVNLTGTAAGGLSGVPIGARAAIVTLTVTQTVDGGFLSMFSNALVGTPATSTVNWTATGQDVAATTTVALDGSGSVKVMAGPNGTHFIVDVIGYYP
jgi:CHRD domain